MTMKLYLVPACLVAAALGAGCSEMHSSAMGAGPSPSTGTLCKDGTVLGPDSSCAQHGGVDTTRSSGASSGARPRGSQY
jgi:hypothetical protein